MSSKEITDYLNRWVTAFSESTSSNTCTLYNENATLWGTVSPIKRDSAALIKDYFDQLSSFSNRNVTIDDYSIRLFEHIAICNGLYTFRWLDNGEEVTIAARFSFVYLNENNVWSIIEHHSSPLPK